MAGKVNYRIVTLVAALGAAILSAIALACLVTAVVEFRAEDFFTASKTKDFTTLGTCVETMTTEQLKELDYNNPELDCSDNDEQGNRKKVMNTLRSTVHGVYWAYNHPDALVDAGKGDGSTMAAKDKHNPGEFLRTVHAAQVGHVLGKQLAFGYNLNSFLNVGLNYSMVFKALVLVDELNIPTSCDDIYQKDDGTNFVYTDISDDHLMFTQSAATQALPGNAGVQIGGHYVDNEWETYIKHIREGRLDDEEKTKANWPLQEFTVDCPGDAQTLGVDYIPGVAAGAPGEEEGVTLTEAQKKYMYAHCVAQFQFASVGSHAWDGTYGIPLPGIEPGPFFHPYSVAIFDTFKHIDGFNEHVAVQHARAHLPGTALRLQHLGVRAHVPRAVLPARRRGRLLPHRGADAARAGGAVRVRVDQPEQHPRQPGDRGHDALLAPEAPGHRLPRRDGLDHLLRPVHCGARGGSSTRTCRAPLREDRATTRS